MQKITSLISCAQMYVKSEETNHDSISTPKELWRMISSPWLYI